MGWIYGIWFEVEDYTIYVLKDEKKIKRNNLWLT